MDAQSVRRAADAERLRALTSASAGKISVFDEGARVGRYVIDMRYLTAGSRDYPRVKQPATRVVLELGARYPFQPPTASIVTPIFHPNVFASGVVCLGAKWLPSEGMDLFVQRLARLITFDPLLVNVHSAANAEAMHWYARAVRAHPEAFPTDMIALPGSETAPPRVQWQTRSDDRVLVPCPRCATRLRLPAGREGSVECPHCAHRFTART